MSEGSESAAGEDGSEAVGVLRELGDEQRVALVPEDAGKLVAAGWAVLVEQGAGAAAYYPDDAYEKAGASVAGRAQVIGSADLLVCVSRPSDADISSLRPGQAVIGVLAPLLDTEYLASIAASGATAVSLDALPRTLSRAQTMDILSSQSSIAGYKAALVAAEHYGRYFPLLMTAAGTAPPAEVLVLGAGVAGLQAIATAHRLGAVVYGYDVRPEAKEQVESLGGRFLELKSVADAAGEGGYARALSEEETRAQQEELNGHIARRDVVITTAQVPGRRPPLLVTEQAVRAMRPGSVIVDMAASTLGGNVALSKPGEIVQTDNGVTIVGAGALASSMAPGASAAFSHNVFALIAHMSAHAKVAIDLSDEIQAAVVVAHDGAARVGEPAARPNNEESDKG